VKSIVNLREAFVVFLALGAIACLNAGQIKQQHNSAIILMNWELTQVLALNKTQMQRIHDIHVRHEVALSRLTGHDITSKQQEISRLLGERNQQILKVLTRDQQKILYHYCTDVISFSEME
jgi:hypothetical protein